MKRICPILLLLVMLASCATLRDLPRTDAPDTGLPSAPGDPPHTSVQPGDAPPEASEPDPTEPQSPSDAASESDPALAEKPGKVPAGTSFSIATPESDPMVRREYRGISFEVRSSWEEQQTEDGTVLFALDYDCIVMLQQIEHAGDTADRELLQSVMEALAPGGRYPTLERDGFEGSSCRYVCDADARRLQCISYAYVHGGVVSTLTILLEGEHMEAAQATLNPILDSLILSAD